MFDLAGRERDNGVSPDLPEYIMGNESVRVALRMARDKNSPDAVWQKVIEMLARYGSSEETPGKMVNSYKEYGLPEGVDALKLSWKWNVSNLKTFIKCKFHHKVLFC